MVEVVIVCNLPILLALNCRVGPYLWDLGGRLRHLHLLWGFYGFHVLEVLDRHQDGRALAFCVSLEGVPMKVGLLAYSLPLWDVPGILFLELLKVFGINIRVDLRHIWRCLDAYLLPIDSEEEGMCLDLLHSVDAQPFCGIGNEPPYEVDAPLREVGI